MSSQYLDMPGRLRHVWGYFGSEGSFITLLSTLTFALFILCLAGPGKSDPHRHKWFENPQQQLKKSGPPPKSRNVAQRLAEANSDVAIFWGSQSGTAEALAYRLTRDLKRQMQIPAILVDLADFDFDTLRDLPPSKICIFLVSTYGNGDPSDNAIEFMDYLATTKGSLSNLRYAVFGLGNSNYKYYNRIAHLLISRLSALGAGSPILTGNADDAQQSTAEDFLEWKDSLLPSLKEDLGIGECEYRYEPVLRINMNDSVDPSELLSGEPLIKQTKLKSPKTTVSSFQVKSSRNLIPTRGDGGACLHLEFEIGTKSLIKYKTGDYMAIWPVNPAHEVTRLLSVLGLESKRRQPITLELLDHTYPDFNLPNATTIEALFQNYLQITAPVSRETIQALCQFAPSEGAKAWLQRLTDKATYQQHVAGRFFTLGRALEQSSTKLSSWSSLPLAFIVECLPAMTPRRYSISSSSLVSPRNVSLTVSVKPAILEDFQAVIPGLATSYLWNIGSAKEASPSGVEELTVIGQLIRSKFKLPLSSDAPLIMVAAGSGIAPFRGFLYERARLASFGQSVGKMLLFFGCRNPDHDFLYGEELLKLESGSLKHKLEILTACSRIPGQPKRYVQDRMQEPEVQSTIARLMVEDNATIYFCGSTAMAKAAGAAVLAAVQRYLEIGEDQANAWADQRKRFNRWQEDVWG